MRTAKIFTFLILAICLAICSAKAKPTSSGFTYQGRLIDANQPADGPYDFQFKLFDANVAGSQLGLDVNTPEVDVIDGHFTVELDFGNEFNGNKRWLEIAVRPGDLNDPNTYTMLSPRQEVTPTPYAIYALNGGDGDITAVNAGTGLTGGGTFGNVTLDVSVPLSLTGLSFPAVINATNTGSNPGIYGYSSGVGVYGESSSGNGVKGYASTGNGVGVYGYNHSSANYGYLGTSDCGVYGKNNSSGTGVYGESSSGYGVRGEHNSSGNYGCLGRSDTGVYGYSNSSYGVYGKNNSSGVGVYGSSTTSGVGIFGYNSSGNYGYLGTNNCGVYGNSPDGNGLSGESSSGHGVKGYASTTSGAGVYGYSVSGNYGYLGTSDCGVYGCTSSDYGVYGHSSGSGYAGFFNGDVYVTGEMSAQTVTDRTPYPKDLATAYQAVMSMERLPNGQYNENDKENQLDHSKLGDFIRSRDGNRDLSATVSCQNEVIKDLIKQNKELNKRLEALEQKLAERM